MALITCYDPEGREHQKEPIDAREACLHNGFTMALPGAVSATEYVPTKEELLVMRDALINRTAALDEWSQRLDEQQRANEAEAERLAGDAAKAVAAPATGKGKAAAAPAA